MSTFKEQNSALFFFLVISILAVAYAFSPTTDIPDQKLELAAEKYEKVKKLSPIVLFDNGRIFTIDCRDSYIITSSGTSYYGEKAKWSCPSGMNYIACPDFALTAVDGKVLFSAQSGYVSEYSPEQVFQCVDLAIENATDELRYVGAGKSVETKNKEAWEALENDLASL